MIKFKNNSFSSDQPKETSFNFTATPLTLELLKKYDRFERQGMSDLIAVQMLHSAFNKYAIESNDSEKVEKMEKICRAPIRLSTYHTPETVSFFLQFPCDSRLFNSWLRELLRYKIPFRD